MTARAVAQGMSKHSGGLQALNGVSFAIEAGQVGCRSKPAIVGSGPWP